MGMHSFKVQAKKITYIAGRQVVLANA
jgi:hypothetical protein